MNQICTTCGAPISGKKCEYCGGRSGKEVGAHHIETSSLNDGHTDTLNQYDSATVLPSHTDLAIPSKKQSILLLMIYVIGMFVLPLIIMVAVMLIGGLESDTMTRQENLNMTTAGIVISYGMLTFALLLITKDVFKRDFKKIKSWGNLVKQMGIGVLCTFAAAAVGNFLVQLVGVDDVAANQEAVEAALGAMPLAMMFSVVVFAPIVEEIIFRLVLMKLFNWRPVYNILFSSFIFGFVHIISGGFVHIIPYFLMALVFGTIYHKNDNIWHATILHVLHNGLSVGLLFVSQGLLAY